MTLSRVEKEKLVPELYYNKDYRYRDIVTELKMSPNQIRDIIRRHDEKNSPKPTKRRNYLYLLMPTSYSQEVKQLGSSNNAGYTSDSGDTVPFRILETSGPGRTCYTVCYYRG